MKMFFLLLFSSLSYGRDYSVIISKTVPKDLTPIFVKNVIDLNKEVGGNHITFVNSLLNKKIYIDYDPVQFENAAGMAIRRTFYCRITLYPLSEGIYKTTLWHEIGHCLGLNHNGVVGRIMSEKVKAFQNYSQEEVEFFLNDVRRQLR